eukprot:CAMPEP_0172851122 /NCGR_PEP_ID=MMETSP1075-20121228/51463_1 /TAXON_ID=2916 /ORGANISM="Ceratium fusus, Strain PA161109" /LENGTH=36 /DNA_ID= /DNA_START= /DNA_END= /DNA_ORIENTATION=
MVRPWRPNRMSTAIAPVSSFALSTENCCKSTMLTVP